MYIYMYIYYIYVSIVYIYIYPNVTKLIQLKPGLEIETDSLMFSVNSPVLAYFSSL